VFSLPSQRFSGNRPINIRDILTVELEDHAPVAGLLRQRLAPAALRLGQSDGRNGRPSEKVISDHSTVRTSPLPGLDGSGISSSA